jgi:hypothetical protein
MAEIVDLLQNVAQKIRRAPEPTLVHAYREAARKFCVESHWLRRETPVLTEADVPQYDLVETGMDDPLLEIIGVRVITIAGTGMASRRINPSDPMGWDPSTEPGAPVTWCYIPEQLVNLFPTPDAVYTLTVTLEVQPLVDAESLPDDLLRKWDRALSQGALAYLYDLHGQPWYNPQLARKNELLFQAAINNAKADVQRAYNTGTVMARIRRLF